MGVQKRSVSNSGNPTDWGNHCAYMSVYIVFAVIVAVSADLRRDWAGRSMLKNGRIRQMCCVYIWLSHGSGVPEHPIKRMQDFYICRRAEHDTAIERCACGRGRRVWTEEIQLKKSRLFDSSVCAKGGCTWWRDQETLTEVMVSAEATISARPALMMCSSRSLSIGSIPLGTLSIRENIRCNSDGDRENLVMTEATFWCHAMC